MKKSLEEFAEAVRDRLEEKLPDCTVKVIHVKKNNGVDLTGVTIRKGTCSIAQNYYLDNYFAQHVREEDAAEEVADAFEEHLSRMPSELAEQILDFQVIRDKVCMKLVNTKKNERFLAGVPSVQVFDLSVVFYVSTVIAGEVEGSIIVSNELQESWDVSTDTLCELATKNTWDVRGVRVESLREFLAEQCGEAEELPPPTDSKHNVTIATSRNGNNGAVVMLNKKLLAQQAEQCGENLFVIPSSVHEVLLVPEVDSRNKDNILQMVQEVNMMCVAEEEILSDSVYYYNAESDELTMFEQGDGVRS